MYYYLTAVASLKYHGRDLLTYASPTKLLPGSIVAVPLQKQSVTAFIVETTTKPGFTTKLISDTYKTVAPLPLQSLKLFQWMREYYSAPLGAIAQLFIPVALTERRQHAPPTEPVPYTSSPFPPLTSEQKETLKSMQNSGSYMLHGETGSGKTRVYIELAKNALAQHSSSIILTPEISLTSQLALEFSKAFNPGQLIILHSQLTSATRRNIWLRLLDKDKNHIVIGPRSALFSPLPRLGFIAVDESHESAYKQENAPHYHAVRVAGKLAALHDAHLVLGSATPSISDYFIADARKRPILRMHSISSEPQPNAAIVDMRDRTQQSRSPHLSNALLEGVEKILGTQQQALLFINRRGTARIVLCENCGWQASCPHCDLPLTYHHDNHTLRCHTCGIIQKALSSCPKCGNAEIILKSIGTKSVATEIQKFFPAARVERFDTDSLKGERVHELYDDIRNGNIDVLVGTQMLAKGLDLPKLGFVGVINADASLYLPDFTAQERTYQLLYQVVGRVGRSSQATGSSSVIQTYSPESPTIQAAAKRDWETFYKSELAERQQFLFPPFCYLLKISCKRVKSETAFMNARKFAGILRDKKLPILIDGPAPAFHEKVQNKYVWQLVIKSKQRTALLEVIDFLPNDWSYDIDPINLL